MLFSTIGKKRYAFITKLFIPLTIACFLLLSYNAMGQAQLPVCTKPNGAPNPPNCRSNDLQVVGAFLTAGNCFCTAGQNTSATLNFKLFNKTGSFRTAFAFYAILEQRSSSGALLSSSYITDCINGVPADDTSIITFADPINFICGASLTLTNVYLAWTDAADQKVCDLAFCDIGPKCGRPGNITIRSLLTAQASSSVSCDNASTGSLTVTPSGGTGPYDILIQNVTKTTTYASYSDTSAAVTKTGLSAQTYQITVTDASNPTCTYTFQHTVGSITCCTDPDKPLVCENRAGLCGDGKVSIVLSGLDTDADYYVVSQGTGPNYTYRDTLQRQGTSLTFTGLTPGAQFIAFGVDTANGTTCYGDTADCDDITVCETTLAGAGTAKQEVQDIKLAPNSAPKVNAAPNPFNDRIRFRLESTVSGQGSLELYNLMGQKVKVIYQGHVEKGVIKTIDYSVPYADREGLIYQFRVGDQKTSGKLLGLKK